MKHFTFISYAFHGRPKEYQAVKLGRNELVGGAEIYLYDLAKMLLNKGHGVTVIQAGSEATQYEWEGINIHQIHFQWLGQRLKLPEQWWGFNRYWLQAIPVKTDHVHLHYLHHAWPAASKDMTATCHGITWDIPYDASVRLQIARYPALVRWFQPMMYFGYTQGERWLAKQGLERVGKIVSVDTALNRFAKQTLPGTEKKITYIPNYVDNKTFSPTDTPTIFHPRFANRRIVLFPRMLSFNRGAHLLVPALLKVVKEFPDVLLVVVGSGNAEAYVHEQVNISGLENNVHFLGHLDHTQDMPQLFQNAEIVLIPSIGSEGTSLSCLEAMATKKPIIASKVGGLPDLIEHERNGLLIEPKSEPLASAIIRLMTNQKLAASLASAAHSDTVHIFNKSRWEEAYSSFFGL